MRRLPFLSTGLPGACAALAVVLWTGSLAGGWAQLPANLVVNVNKGGGVYVDLNLTRYSIRSASFRVVSWDNASGYVVEHSPANPLMPVRTYRGYVAQNPNERVTAIIDVDNTLDATVHNGSGRIWTVSNVDVSGLLGGSPPHPLPLTGVPVTNSPPPSGTGSQAPPGNYMPPVNLYTAHGVYDIPSSQYKGSVDASLAWLEYQWNIHDFFNSRDAKLNILLTEVFVRKEQFYFPANGNWSQFVGMLRTEWLAQGINERGFIGSAFPTGFSYAGGYAVGNNFYNTGGEAICVNALYHENAHNWGAQHYYYGVDTMSGSYPAHGEMNVARVLNNRNREIGEGGPVLTTNAVSLVHPYAYVDIVTTLTNSPVNLAPLANDWDANGETLSIKYFTTNTVKGGTVTKSGNVLTYTPASGYVGKDIIVYEVQDAAGLFSQEVIHIEVVNQGLAAHWAFEDASGQTATDSSGHGHAGTLSGAAFGVGTVPGPVGNAISLGSGQYMVCDNTDLIAEPETAYPVDSAASNFFDPMDRSFTLTCWFKLGDPSQTATLFTKRNPGFFGYILTASSGGLSTTVRPWDGNGSWYTVSGGSTISAVHWYHAAMVINRTNHSLRLYLNGVEVGTAATLPSDKFIFNGREDLRMGGGGPVRLDEAQIHSKALTPAEIAALYASGTPPATEAAEPSPANDAFNVAITAQLSWQAGGASNKFDLYFGTDAAAIAAATTNSPLYKGRINPMTFNPGYLGVANTYYWRVDVVPPSGPVLPGDVWHFTTADSPLTANLLVHLTLDDAHLSDTNIQDIALAADNFGNDGATSGQVGQVGQAFAFNGSNSVVQSINADIIPASSGGTLSLWMKTTNTTSGTYLLNVEGAWVLQYQGGGVLAFLDGSSSGNGTYGTGLNDGNWHHVLAANDGATTRLYVDGTQAGSYAEVIYNLNSLAGRQTAVGVAYSGSGSFFTGAIDDVGIWSRGLSAADVSLIYSNGLAGRSFEREVVIARTGFEAAEGFTGYVSPNFAALGTKTNTADGSIWSGLVGDVQIWNRSDIPPNGVQCLKLGDADGQCRVRFPGTNHGVGMVSFDYAAYSTSTDTGLSLSYSNATSGGWVEVWTTHLTGNNPAWETKPWPTASVPINVGGDVDLLLKEVGNKGVLVDNFRLTGKSNYPPAFTFSPFTRPNGTSGVAYSATMGGEAYDPSAFDTLTYSKVGGPVWLNVATDGALSGTPTGGDSGTNTFTVRVTDSTGQSSEATLLIYVVPGPGALMAGAAPNASYTNFWAWFASDNPASPNGSGADADGAVVTRWDDVRGAFDHDLARNSGGGGGIFRTNRANGLPAIQYTGTRNNWGAFSTAGEFQTIPNGCTLFLVARVNALPVATGYLFDNSSPTGGGVGLRVAAGSPAKWEVRALRNSPSVDSSAVTADVVTNQFQVHAVQVSGTNMMHYLNGVLAGSGTFDDGGTPLPMSGLILSCNAGVGNHLECDVAEVLAYNAVLNSSDRGAVESYLLAKYALVLPPPAAPLITPSLGVGGLQMSIASQAGYTYVLQAATNLVPPITWSGVATNAGTGGVLNFSAPVNASHPQNYFRVVAY